MIAIEGNIAVGKTTLVEKLSKMGYPVMKEPMNTDLLDLFYKNPKQYGYAFQLSMVQMRYWSVLRNQDNRLLLDRSAIGDAVFARAQEFTEQEMRVYYSMLHCLDDKLTTSPSVRALTGVIYLKDSPNNCLQRIYQRNREFEAGISLDYLNRLDSEYDVIIGEIQDAGTPVITRYWGEYDNAELIAADIEKLLDQESNGGEL